MKYFFARFFNAEGIPHGVRVVTANTAIRWIGWGFAETLIPVFLYSFGTTYAEAGLLKASYDIAFILSILLIGTVADCVSATTLMLIGCALYLFVGTGYLLAGSVGLVVAVVFVRMINGVAYAFDLVGRETYFRRHVSSEKLATAFGYFDTIANFWWIMAALAGIWLLKYFEIYELLFLITPAAFVATGFLVVYKRKKNRDIRQREVKRKKFKEIFEGMGLWGGELRTLVMFNFFIAFSWAVVGFFIPIETYSENGSLAQIVLLGVVFSLPQLLGWPLGKWFDKRGSSLFLFGLVVLGLCILSIAFFDSYLWKVITLFVIGATVELLSVGNNELITAHANPEHLGRMGGIVRSITTIGVMTGPIVIGTMIDNYGLRTAFISNSLLIFALAVLFFFQRRRTKIMVSRRS